jgi:hypothetical protein
VVFGQGLDPHRDRDPYCFMDERAGIDGPQRPGYRGATV